MDKSEIEKYKRELAKIEAKLTEDAVKELTREQVEEYIVLVSKIKAILELLENLDGISNITTNTVNSAYLWFIAKLLKNIWWKKTNFVTNCKVIRHIDRGGKSDARYGANL